MVNIQLSEMINVNTTNETNLEVQEKNSVNVTLNVVLQNNFTMPSITETTSFSEKVTSLTYDFTNKNKSSTNNMEVQTVHFMKKNISNSLISDEHISTSSSFTNDLSTTRKVSEDFKTDSIKMEKETSVTTYITEKDISTKQSSKITKFSTLKSAQINTTVSLTNKVVSTINSILSDKSKDKIATESTPKIIISPKISTSSIKHLSTTAKLFTNKKMKALLKSNQTIQLKNINNYSVSSKSSTISSISIPKYFNHFVPSKEISRPINRTSVPAKDPFGATTLVLIVVLPFLTLFIIAIVIVLKKKFKRKTDKRKRNRKEDFEMDTKEGNQREPLNNINVDT